MSTLDDWITEAGRTLSLPAGPIPADLRNELLDLTRDVAHGVARVAGPLTCYLAGIAVGRGAAPGATVAALAALAQARIREEESAAQPGTPTEGMAGEQA
jgi:hypothetical protein